RVEPVSKNKNLPQKISGFLPEPLEDPGFRKDDCILGQPEFLAHPRGRLAAEAEPPEGLPRLRGEAGADDRQELLDDVPAVILIPLAGEVVVRVETEADRGRLGGGPGARRPIRG